MREIYLAGGWFWSVEHYFSAVKGVLSVESGYAQSDIENPSYEDLCNGNCLAVETVKITYDHSIISLEELVNKYIDIIDPTTLNRQGPNIGIQYRSGIYYIESNDLAVIQSVLKNQSKNYAKPLVVEVEQLKNYFRAEEYHQEYIKKNPQTACSLNLNDDEVN